MRVHELIVACAALVVVASSGNDISAIRIAGLAPTTFGASVGTNPALATQENVDILIQHLENTKDSVAEGSVDERSDTVYALGRCVEKNPTLATPRIVEALLPLLKIDDRMISSDAASALIKLVEANSQLATSRIVKALIPMLKSCHPKTRADTVSCFSKLIRANPKLATEELVNALTPLLKDADFDVNYRAAAVRKIVASALADMQASAASAFSGIQTNAAN